MLGVSRDRGVRVRCRDRLRPAGGASRAEHPVNRRTFLLAALAAPLSRAARAAARHHHHHASADRLAERIATRYHVEHSAVAHVLELCRRHLPSDPLLLAAMVGVESAWRPWRIGSKGEVGLLQVRPDLHGSSAAELTDPATNVRVAARLLHSLIERHGLHEAIRRYNGAGHATEGYLRRVLREHGRLAAA
jgi:soluble lytic murein transglycosylase-like protein